MSILVPNSFFFLKTLPESCYVCRFKYNGCMLLQKYTEEHDGCIPPFHYTDWHKWTPEDKGRVHGCPLKEIPQHGRLIDADKLKADNPRHMDADVPYVTEVTVEEIIDAAPTVIPASKEDEI